MNLYFLIYECWHVWEKTTSDGFSDMRQDWVKEERYFEARSDINAQEQACKLLAEIIRSGKKVNRPALMRIVALPRVDGVKTEMDLQPWWQHSHYYVE